MVARYTKALFFCLTYLLQVLNTDVRNCWRLDLRIMLGEPQRREAGPADGRDQPDGGGRHLRHAGRRVRLGCQVVLAIASDILCFNICSLHFILKMILKCRRQRILFFYKDCLFLLIFFYNKRKILILVIQIGFGSAALFCL